MPSVQIEVNTVTHMAIQHLAKVKNVDQQDLLKFFVEKGLADYDEEVQAIFNKGVNFGKYLSRRKSEISDDLGIALNSFEPKEI